ncbi:MAG: tetratricopeptide repeat protein [Tepidisphaeraceae bacterium]
MSQTLDEILDAARDHHLAGRLPEAVELYREALQLAPEDAQSVFLLGLAVFQLGQAAEAVDLVGRAISLDPAVAEYHCDLARIRFTLNDLPGAISASRKALELRPDFPEALFNLGNALCRSRRLEDGIDAYQRAITLRSDARDGVNNLGMAQLELGRIDEAVACFDRILASNPSAAAAHSNRIYALHFKASISAAEIRRELIRWNQRHAYPLKVTIVPHLRRRRPKGTSGNSVEPPLRIGYVSPDFREHVVGWNLLAFLPEHDPKLFHISCYSSVASPDAVTRQLQSHVASWRDITKISDEHAAQMIREDQIDILIDLSLHTGGNRLLIFARKPAPIQVSYLGYPGSTGLEAMDYRLSDPFLDSDEELADHTERTIRLPRTYWCYRPGGPTPPVVPPPALSTGTITFGSLNAFQKISGPTLDLWRDLMQAAPRSRLLLHAPAGRHRQQLIQRFQTSGIAAHRIEFVERLPWPEYIQSYQRIDIALDPFPYGGGITTCDALWMGVATITLRGKTSVGRSGTSILGNLNLPQYIAQSPEQYISAARALASDLPLLSDLRSNLRGRMLKSPLMDGLQFARDLEAAFLKMWDQWTNSSGG